MSNQAYLYNAPAGVPGTVTRVLDSRVEPIILGEAFSAFGLPFKFNSSGEAVNLEEDDLGSVVKGFIARSVPAINGGGASAESFASGSPSEDQPCGGLRTGYMNVLCNVGTPVKGGKVYVRTVADTGKPIGSLETAGVVDEVFEVPGVEWGVNGKDADNITEIYKAY